jgi:serine/threonine protein phosphatase PrpC
MAGMMRAKHTSVSVDSAKGTRLYQEDRWVNARIELRPITHGRGRLLGVMDGHGGISAVEKVADNLEAFFSIALRRTKGTVDKALAETVKHLSELTYEDEAGTTLSIAYIPDSEKRVHLAILGDSPVIVQGQDRRIYLSPIHNVRCNPPELKAAFKKGARYYRGYIFDPTDRSRGLQMSRSLGDCHLVRILNRRPEIYSVDLEEGSFILLGTDGLFNPLDLQVQTIVKAVNDGSDAKDLVKDALQHQAEDNVTAILWKYSRENDNDG